MSRAVYWPTREIMVAVLEAVRDYEDAEIPLKKTEVVQGMFSTNYAYVLGILNSMFVFGYLTDNDGYLHITYTGRDFVAGIPF